jgi:hypothetical protein
MSDLTFFSKKHVICPVCDTSFFKEEMRTGRGRLIAGSVTQELRRTYEPSQKYGEVFPLIYTIMVCPNCYYGAFPADFSNVPEDVAVRLQQDMTDRFESIRPVFDRLEFSEPRTLREGIASYYFAVRCYDFFPKDFSPTLKQGIASLRAAWLASDLNRLEPGENFDTLSNLFYRKARFFYAYAIEQEQSGAESIPNDFHLGPDIDKNYGYDGVLYLSGLLEWKYGPRGDKERRRVALQRAKRTVARIFGMGKASKNKPAVILDNARDVYEEIAKELGLENRDPEAAAAGE